MAEKNLISLGEIAVNHGRHSQSVHKFVRRLGIETVKVKDANARGQKVSCITMEDYARLEQLLTNSPPGYPDRAVSHGSFYLALLEPDLDPGRFKVGFATDVDERIRRHKTVAPLLTKVREWPCKLLWEKTAIECVTYGCEQLYTEVYRTSDIKSVIGQAEKFFRLMPQLTEE